jgi:hypothetical protein
MRAARLTRRQAAGNRFSAGQPPVAAAIVPTDANQPVAGRTRHLLPAAPVAADLRGYSVEVCDGAGRADVGIVRAAMRSN